MSRRVELGRAAAALLVAGLCAVAGCDPEPLNSGSRCALNTDCAEPLVCRLERCRRQCVDSRDCGAGLLCLRLEDLDGACQLPEESRCSLTSECTPGLECRFGTCTTECLEDRDCQPGASCEYEPDEEAYACVEPVTELCIYDSDCPPPLVCTEEQLCQLECVEDRDCQAPRRCVDNLCHLPDGG